MLKRVMFATIGILMSLEAYAREIWKDPDTGIEWSYWVYHGRSGNGEVTIGGDPFVDEHTAIPTSTIGDVVVPTTLGGYPVKYIGETAFWNCDKITSVRIPEGVVEIECGAFSSCSKLSRVVLPNSLKTIQEYAFRNCVSLTSVSIPSGVTKIGGFDLTYCPELEDWPFSWCENLSSITVDKNNPNYASVGGLLLTKDGKQILRCAQGVLSVEIPLGVTTVWDGAFNFCSKITSLTIPEHVTSVGYGAFYGCSNLASLEISSGVKSIGEGVVACCDSLKRLSVASSNARYKTTGGLLMTKDGSVVLGCVAGMSSVSIPQGVEVVGERAFQWQGVRKVTFPSSLRKIGGDAFSGGLFETISLPPGLVEIGVAAFEYCENLSSVQVPANVRVIEGGFEAGPFFGCKSLKTVVIEDGVEVVGRFAFSVCESLSTVSIPPSVTNIEDSAFWGDNALKTIYVAAGDVSRVRRLVDESESDLVGVRYVVGEQSGRIKCGDLSEGSHMVGVAGPLGGMPISVDAPYGVKSLSVKGLPNGMKLSQDKYTGGWAIVGCPTKGGSYVVELTARLENGKVLSRTSLVTVEPLSEMAVGTFNGFAVMGGANAGTVQMTATEAGKITAKVVTAMGSCSFSASSWDSVDDGVYSASLSTKDGDELFVSLDTKKAWNTNQLEGRFFLMKSFSFYDVCAQRNAYGKQWYFDAVYNASDSWLLSYSDNPKTAAITVSLNADGKTMVSGKINDVKVSASGYCDLSGIGAGYIKADFAPVVTVNKLRTVLSIKTNLWYDRKNDHATVGSVELVR